MASFNVQRRLLGIGFPHERSNPGDHIARSIPVADNRARASRASSRFGMGHRQPAQAGIAVGHDARQRLVNFVGNGGCQFSHRHDPCDMSQLCLRLAQGLFACLRSVMSLLVSRVASGLPCSSCCIDHRLATMTCVPSRFVWTSSPSQRPVRSNSAFISSSGAGRSSAGADGELGRRPPLGSIHTTPRRPIPVGDDVIHVAHEDRVVREVEKASLLAQTSWSGCARCRARWSQRPMRMCRAWPLKAAGERTSP